RSERDHRHAGGRDGRELSSCGTSICKGAPTSLACHAPRWHDGVEMNARTQIKLDPAVQRQAQAKAAELGISFAEYVRRLVSQDLGAPQRKAHISVVFDLGASGQPTNVARDKHKMIDAAVWEEYLRKTDRKPAAARRRKTSKA